MNKDKADFTQTVEGLLCLEEQIFKAQKGSHSYEMKLEFIAISNELTDLVDKLLQLERYLNGEITENIYFTGYDTNK